jgi:hypothetical protein
LVGDGVDVGLAVAVAEAVALGSRVGEVGEDVGLGVGLPVGVEIPGRATLGPIEGTLSSDEGPKSVDGVSPSCETTKRRSRAARNQ